MKDFTDLLKNLERKRDVTENELNALNTIEKSDHQTMKLIHIREGKFLAYTDSIRLIKLVQSAPILPSRCYLPFFVENKTHKTMKSIDEILERHTNSEEWTSGFKSDITDAMKEYAEEYHLRQLKQNYKPTLCKGCKYWTVVDALGGEYCRVLEKTVASPRDDYKHKDCPL